jgi:hypothetical protein
MTTPTSSLNLRIAQLLKDASPEDIVDVLAGPEAALLAKNNNNNNNNNSRAA